MSLFENAGRRGDYLDKEYSYMLIIKPTSVESERAVSSAGLFATKIRNRFHDDPLDEPLFLKSYLLLKKKKFIH